jgi:hypothetical protein
LFDVQDADQKNHRSRARNALLPKVPKMIPVSRAEHETPIVK